MGIPVSDRAVRARYVRGTTDPDTHVASVPTSRGCN